MSGGATDFSNKWHYRVHQIKVDHEYVSPLEETERLPWSGTLGMGWGPAPHLGRGWWLRLIIQTHAQVNLSRPLKDVCVCLTWRFILQKSLNLKVIGVCQRMQHSPEHGLEGQLLVKTWEHWRLPLLFYRATWQTWSSPIVEWNY